MFPIENTGCNIMITKSQITNHTRKRHCRRIFSCVLPVHYDTQKKALRCHQKYWIRPITISWEQQSRLLIVYQVSCKIWPGQLWTHLRDTWTNGCWKSRTSLNVRVIQNLWEPEVTLCVTRLWSSGKPARG